MTDAEAQAGGVDARGRVPWRPSSAHLPRAEVPAMPAGTTGSAPRMSKRSKELLTEVQVQVRPREWNAAHHSKL